MERLRVATWNIHGFVGTDGVRDPERTGRVLRNLGVELAGLQEVDCRGEFGDQGDPLERAAAVAGLTAVPGPCRFENAGHFGNALLTAHPVHDVRHVDLSVAGRERRGLLDVLVEAGQGRWLRVVVTHFGLTARERLRQVQLLLQRVRPEPDRPLVLLGDFNEWRPKAPTVALIEAALGRTPHVRSFPTRWPFLALDRIWVHPVTCLRQTWRATGPDSRVASDHRPVVAELTLPEPPRAPPEAEAPDDPGRIRRAVPTIGGAHPAPTVQDRQGG